MPTVQEILIRDASNQERFVSTIDKLIAYVGELSSDPNALTMLGRLKALTTGISLAAGENAIGKVGGHTQLTSLTPAVDPDTNYVNGDVIGGKLQVTNATRVLAGSTHLAFLSLVSKVQITVGTTLVFFKADPAASTLTDNVALTINAADIDKVLATLPISGSEWTQLGSIYVATKSNLMIPFKPIAGSTVFAALVAGGAIDLASTSDLILNFGFRQD